MGGSIDGAPADGARADGVPAEGPPLDRAPAEGASARPVIRTVRFDDDLDALTRLIRAAYAPHAAAGLRYWATHQSAADTARRLAAGQGFVACARGEYVGTITVRPPRPDAALALYRDPETWSIGQLAVLPARKGQGIGRALHDAALAHAARHGARVLALDTAAPATGLIALYRAWGYEVVGEADWRPDTNYVSVVMARPIEPALGAGLPGLTP